MTRLIYGDIGHEPKLEPNDDELVPICPCCGQEAITFYVTEDNDVIGCEECVSRTDAVEYVYENSCC